MKKNDESDVRELFEREGDSLYYKLARYNAAVVVTLKPDLFEGYPDLSAYLTHQIESLRQHCTSQTGQQLPL